MSSMKCPACGSDELLVPRLELKDLPELLRLMRPIECYPCCQMFLGSAVEVFRWQFRSTLDRLQGVRIPRVRIRATGVLGDTLESLIGPGTALVRRDPFQDAPFEERQPF